jgi:hypothetical protein
LSRTNFTWKELAENVITTIVKNILPYTEIPYHNVVVNGSDLKIYYHGKLLAKFEILNFDSRSYINFRRAKSIRENLKNVKYKGLICSFFNATSRARDILKNIPVCTIGFQLLPSKFHQYYASLNKVHHRRIANNRSLKQLKNTLISFFHRIGLDLLMYVSRTKISVSNTLNLKNESLKIRAKEGETENKEARTEGNTQSSTSREYTVSTTSVGTETRRLKLKEISFDSKEISPNEGKISTVSVKIRAFYNRFKASMLDLLSNLWNNRHGSVTLVDWIPVEVDSIKKYLELGEGNKKYDSESKCPQGLEPISSKSSATFRDKFRTELAKTCKLLNGMMNFLSSVRMLVLKLWKASKEGFLWL